MVTETILQWYLTANSSTWNSVELFLFLLTVLCTIPFIVLFIILVNAISFLVDGRTIMVSRPLQCPGKYG